MANEDRYLTFDIAGQSYGVSTDRIREVIPSNKVTPVPDVPTFILGVTSIRNEIVPVVDMKLLFACEEPTEIDSRACFIVVLVEFEEDHIQPISLLVHRIHAAYRIAGEKIEPPPSVNGRPQVAYLAGLGKTDDGVKVLLDVDKLLAKHSDALRRVLETADDFDAETVVREAQQKVGSNE